MNEPWFIFVDQEDKFTKCLIKQAQFQDKRALLELVKVLYFAI